MTTKGLSLPATTLRALELVEDLPWERAKVADVGAGQGSFSRLLGERLEQEQGLDAREHVFPCDLIPESFAYERLRCRRTEPDGRLPFEDDTFDAVVSIEVIEHVEDQFEFLRELVRIARPGGRIVVTTPNVRNLSSRLRILRTGFPQLFDPLPLEDQDVRTTGGHIHPIAPYYLFYAAQRAGIERIRLRGDRTKRSSAGWAVAFSPLLGISRLVQTGRLRRMGRGGESATTGILADLWSWDLLTSRTVILSGVKARARMVELHPVRADGRVSGDLPLPEPAL